MAGIEDCVGAEASSRDALDICGTIRSSNCVYDPDPRFGRLGLDWLDPPDTGLDIHILVIRHVT